MLVQPMDAPKRHGGGLQDAVQLVAPGDLISLRGAHVSERLGDNQQQSISKKKSYKKPSFRQEKVFETTALSCGKVDPTVQNQCSLVRKS